MSEYISIRDWGGRGEGEGRKGKRSGGEGRGERGKVEGRGGEGKGRGREGRLDVSAAVLGLVLP